MRGAQNKGMELASHARIIPAYAGSTGLQGHDCALQGDHPRVCGEHAGRQGNKVLRQGSSPRMRGAPGGRQRRGPPSGIIPAYAGSTGPDIPVIDIKQGSSPRMRGAHTSQRVNSRICGIIPAYAGSTWLWCVAVVLAWDHPRVCGEHFVSVISTVSLPGSSPRMRGARVVRCLAVAPSGIIPAYAGSTAIV